MKVKKKRKNKTIKKPIKRLSLTAILLLIISFGVFFYAVYSINIIPIKYLIIAFIILLILNMLVILLNLKTKKNYSRMLSILVAIALSTIYLIGFRYINRTYNFLGNIAGSEKITEKYYIVVLNNSKYSTIDDLKNKSIESFNEKINIYENALEKINKKIDVSIVEADSISKMAEDLLNNKVDAIMISSVHKNQVEEDNKDFESMTKNIFTIEAEARESKVEVSDVNIAKETFSIYVSGNDAYGSISDRGRSDVNMVITINPKTNEILLTSIPRDYYVQIHGTTGYKDKLTHAGMYGVNSSVKTIEDFMEIDIDYYIKVNFTTLVGLVDAIGGIDIYSDASFVPWTNQKLYIKKGMVHMNGETAIAFARERHAYNEGDRHRIQNQQDVLKGIIDKMTSSTTILWKYDSILNNLSSSFETNITKDNISQLIKLQISEMPSWNIKTYNLNGGDSSQYTYSYGKQLLYVMPPYENTINVANQLINGMKSGKTLENLNYDELSKIKE